MNDVYSNLNTHMKETAEKYNQPSDLDKIIQNLPKLTIGKKHHNWADIIIHHLNKNGYDTTDNINGTSGQFSIYFTKQGPRRSLQFLRKQEQAQNPNHEIHIRYDPTNSPLSEVAISLDGKYLNPEEVNALILNIIKQE